MAQDQVLFSNVTTLLFFVITTTTRPRHSLNVTYTAKVSSSRTLQRPKCDGVTGVFSGVAMANV